MLTSRISLITFAVCTFGLLVTACEPVPHYNRLQVATLVGNLPKKSHLDIKTYMSPSDIAGKYQVVGILSCEGSAGEEAGIINAMLYRAADLGGDGVLLGTGSMSGEEVKGSSVNVRLGWAALIGGGDQRAYRAEVIRLSP